MWAPQLLVELNFDWSEFPFNKIQLKRTGMLIGGKGIKILFMNIVLLKKLLKRHLSMLVTWEWGKHILIRTYRNDDLWNLKFYI